MRNLSMRDIKKQAKMYKLGLITGQELIEAVEALIQKTQVSGRSKRTRVYDYAKDELTKCPKCGGKSLVTYIDGKQCSFCLHTVQ